MEQDNKFIKSLVQNVKLGNDASFEQLFNITAGRAYAVGLRLTAQPALAEEITKEVFLSTWKQISFMRDDIPFAAWLTGAAVYTSLDKLRGTLTKDSRISGKFTIDYEANPEDPEQIISESFEKELLSLPIQTRLCFVLHEIEKYSIEEVGDLLSVNPAEVKKKLNEANELLSAQKSFIGSIRSIPEKVKDLPKSISPSKYLWENIFKELELLKSDASVNNSKKKISEEKTDSDKNISNADLPINTSSSKKGVSSKITAAVVAGVIIVLAVIYFLISNGKI